jgi:PUA domain protein
VNPADQRGSKDHVSIYTVQSEPLFFQHFDEPLYPTLRLLHKCTLLSTYLLRYLPTEIISSEDPYILPRVQVDRGAIRFLLAGAHMMCPGFTSPGGYLPPADAALPAGTPVAIHAEGKEHAVGIGITKLGTEEMRKVNKGVGVEIVTYLGDDLWIPQKL